STKPESSRKKLTETYPLSTTGAKGPKIFGSEKWKKRMFSAARARMPVSASSRDRRAGGACTERVAVAIASSDEIPAADVSSTSTEAGNVVDTQAPRGDISECARGAGPSFFDDSDDSGDAGRWALPQKYERRTVGRNGSL